VLRGQPSVPGVTRSGRCSRAEGGQERPGAVTLGLMGESDWWMCDRCRSLNNLSARKCYSCGHGKPKDSQKASEFMGYVPVVTREGKVRLDFPEQVAGVTAAQEIGAKRQAPPLRDPIPRSITDVAPRVPHGIRVVYRLDGPPPPPDRSVPPVTPPPLMAAPGHPMQGHPMPGPRPVSWRPAPPGLPGMAQAVPPPVAGPYAGPRPLVGMPIGRPAMVGVPVGRPLPPMRAPGPWPTNPLPPGGPGVPRRPPGPGRSPDR
jgi:hypothetical protein